MNRFGNQNCQGMCVWGWRRKRQVLLSGAHDKQLPTNNLDHSCKFIYGTERFD